MYYHDNLNKYKLINNIIHMLYKYTRRNIFEYIHGQWDTIKDISTILYIFIYVLNNIISITIYEL